MRVGGNVTERSLAALNAGCDMILLCNKPDLADELLENLVWKMPAQSITRLTRMHGTGNKDMVALRESREYIKAVKRVAMIGVGEGNLFA